MSPNDVKAIKLLAKHLGIPGEGYNPLTNDEQAEHLVRHFGLLVANKTAFARVPTHWNVSRNGVSLFRLGGVGTRNSAIVYAAATVVDEDWRHRQLFGIDGMYRVPENAVDAGC